MGPIYTLHALILNAFGGKQPRPENASLSRVLGYQLYSKGRYSEATAALRRSVALEPNQEAQDLLEYLGHQATTSNRWSKWKILAPIPSLLVVAFWAVALFYVISSPSGYAVSYQPPPSSDVKPASARNGPARQTVNSLAGSLADIVESRAPIVGSHYEGGTIIQDHVLDRSKFDPSEIRSVESKIRSAMQGQQDPDGFMASALFNAEMLAASIEIVNGVGNGTAVSQEFDEVANIQTDPLISDWLQKSRFWLPCTGLCAKLERYREQYRPGVSTNQLEQNFHQHKGLLQETKAQLDQYESADNVYAYNSLVPEYNAEVAETNSLLRRLRTQSIMTQKLDLAFNKCLDTSILMSRFQQVNLSSHEAEVSNLPDPQ